MMKKQKILIVDDDQDAIFCYISILKDGGSAAGPGFAKGSAEASETSPDGGYAFVSALNAEEALEKIQAERPDLILLDLMMPEKSGIEFFNEIKAKEEFKNIPIIIISGVSKVTGVNMKAYVLQRPYHERKVRVTGKETETRPAEYLEKPVKPDILLKAVNNALGKKTGPSPG